jgi:hypothetical protein
MFDRRDAIYHEKGIEGIHYTYILHYRSVEMKAHLKSKIFNIANIMYFAFYSDHLTERVTFYSNIIHSIFFSNFLNETGWVSFVWVGLDSISATQANPTLPTVFHL